MIDIATATPPTISDHVTLAVPFDWVLLPAPAVKQAWHDHSNLCQSSVNYVDALAVSYALALEAGLHTAVIHSFFTDARAGRDDTLPYGSIDQGGWVGASYLPNNGQQYGAYGSRLWLNYFVISQDEKLEAQRFAAQESLAWLIESGVVDAIEVKASFVNKQTFDMLALHITMRRDGHDQPLYDAVWGATLQHPEGLYATA